MTNALLTRSGVTTLEPIVLDIPVKRLGTALFLVQAVGS